MQWTSNKINVSAYGRTRVITKFLWFPKTLDGVTKWLERVDIQQIGCRAYETIVIGFTAMPLKPIPTNVYKYRDEHWVN